MQGLIEKKYDGHTRILVVPAAVPNGWTLRSRLGMRKVGLSAGHAEANISCRINIIPLRKGMPQLYKFLPPLTLPLRSCAEIAGRSGIDNSSRVY
jgi:hypothetical protein